jgi:hypothetical protein
VYQSLDPGEVLAPVIPPLIPPSFVKVPTVPVQKGSKVNSSDAAATTTAATFEGTRTSPQYDGERLISPAREPVFYSYLPVLL